MITAAEVASIVSQYDRFGWRLRKVLLTTETRAALAPVLLELFTDVEVAVDPDLDAAWFTRESLDGGTAWELRALHQTPFALIEVVDADASDDELATVFANLEERLRERRWSRGNGN